MVCYPLKPILLIHCLQSVYFYCLLFYSVYSIMYILLLFFFFFTHIAIGASCNVILFFCALQCVWFLNGNKSHYMTVHVFVAGVISLPYAEIQEPFEAWLDLAVNASRIDYYQGKKPLDHWLFSFKPDSVFFLLCWISDLKQRACCVRPKWPERNIIMQNINKEVKKNE